MHSQKLIKVKRIKVIKFIKNCSYLIHYNKYNFKKLFNNCTKSRVFTSNNHVIIAII